MEDVVTYFLRHSVESYIISYHIISADSGDLDDDDDDDDDDD